MNFVESLWLSGRASERGIRRSEVRFLMESQNFSLARDKTKKKSFSKKDQVYEAVIPLKQPLKSTYI